MSSGYSLPVVPSLIGVLAGLSLPVPADPPASTALPPAAILPLSPKKAAVVRNYSTVPLAFERNQGQTDPCVRFLAHSRDGVLFLTPSEAVFSMPAQIKEAVGGGGAPHILRRPAAPTQPAARVVLRMQIVGSNSKAPAVQQQPLPGRVSYFIGNRASRWHAGVPTFGRAGFHAVYPGIDLIYYGNQKHLEYDFVVAPRADARRIRLHFAGAAGVRINGTGDLLVRTQGRELRWKKPEVYQQIRSHKLFVAARFQLRKQPDGDADVCFALGRYNSALPLVIDPVLLYASYLGGSGASGGSSGDGALGIAADSSGNAYVTGLAYSTDFPTTAGSFQPVNAAGSNNTTTFVTKINPAGKALIYSTYLGGARPDSGRAIAVDGAGNAYVAGSALSSDFPTTAGAFQSVKRGASNVNNAFVTKLNATGTALIYSTYLGGSGGDSATGIAVDASGSAYVVGAAASADFPTTVGAFQRVKNAANSSNAFVTRLNAAGSALLFSTYLGGSAEDRAEAVAVDSSGAAFVTGYSFSPNFPTTAGAFQSVNNSVSASCNGFVTRINSTGTALLYSTYLGGTYGDSGSGIAVDTGGSAFVAGSAYSSDFPTTPGAYQRTKNAPDQNSANAFVTRLNATGSALVYSTYLGGSKDGGAGGIAIDGIGDAYLAGYTHATDFPTTPGAFQRMSNSRATVDPANAVVARLNPAGTALVYSTYLGGSASDGADCIAIDINGNVYLAGNADSTDFPVTTGAFQPASHALGRSHDAFVAKLFPTPTFPDFNNDGHADLLIQNSNTGVIANWFMQGSNWVGGAYFSLTPPGDFALVGAGDFSGNGATTLVLQSRTTNQVAFWYTGGANSAAITGGNFLNTTPLAGWKVVGVGDFNRDGKSDLVLQNQNTNQVAIWFLNGYLYQGGVLMPLTPPAGWTVAGAGDFNGDGFPDIAFQNQTTGQIALWYMNGPTYAGGALLTTAPAPGWKVVGVGDFNGDGTADLLFQSQTGNEAIVWYLKNGVFAGGDALSLNPPPGWKIVGPR